MLKKNEILKVGDKVKSKYYEEESEVIRTITHICKDSRCGCGYAASADGGDVCPVCHRRLGHPILSVGADWFEKI